MFHLSRWAELEDEMPIDIRGLAPLLSVFDMPASIEFYCDRLGSNSSVQMEACAALGCCFSGFCWVA